MAALHRYYYNVTVPTVNSSTTYHAIRIGTPANRLARLLKITPGTRGTSALDGPPIFSVQIGVSGGLTSGTTVTPRPAEPHIPASACTVKTLMTGGTPTGGTEMRSFPMPAAASVMPEHQEPEVAVSCLVSSFIDVFVTGTTSNLTNCTFEVWWEE